MTDQPGPTPPSGREEPTGPVWGAGPVPPAAPAPPAYGVPPAYQQVTGHQTHQGGLWSMILGIVGVASGVLAVPTSGLTAFGLVCSPVAFGLGVWSSRAIRDRPDLYGNRGHAIAGWVLGLVGMALAVLMLLAALAVVALVLWFYTEVGDTNAAA